MDADKEREFDIIAKLVITNFDCSPAEITQIIGIHPTQTWLKGEPFLPEAKNVQKSNGWILQSPINPFNSTVDIQVKAIMKIIAPQAEAFANLLSGAYAELGCVIYTYCPHYPAVGFSKDTIKTLAKIGGSINIELYEVKHLGEN